MTTGFESLRFAAFHETELPRRLNAASTSLPDAYASRLRPLGIRIRETGESITYSSSGGTVHLETGDSRAETFVEIAHQTWEEIVHDLESVPGLIYGKRATPIRGDLMRFLEWEPALRWMFTGRAVYDPAAVDLRDASGAPLDVTRGFRIDDDREEMAHFLREAGYLWVRNVLSPKEVDELSREAERLRSSARQGDQESWWGKRADGSAVLCRVLRAGKEPHMRALHGDPRLRSLAELCDEPMATKMGAEDQDGVTVLWKQPGVEEGLADLPWHRDCGMGGHASMCPTAVLSVFLGPNTAAAGEIRFLPGSWKMSLPFAEAGDETAPKGVAPPAQAGDVTFHYGDGLHVAPAPTDSEGPFRRSILIGFSRADGRHHRGGRHYNDVLLGSEDGQIQHMSKVAARS
jgi:ectoine hydroxylase-related dioxygenase (phytanoyl-CoA dioxygenase family)